MTHRARSRSHISRKIQPRPPRPPQQHTTQHQHNTTSHTTHGDRQRERQRKRERKQARKQARERRKERMTHRARSRSQHNKNHTDKRQTHCKTCLLQAFNLSSHIVARHCLRVTPGRSSLEAEKSFRTFKSKRLFTRSSQPTQSKYKVRRGRKKNLPFPSPRSCRRFHCFNLSASDCLTHRSGGTFRFSGRGSSLVPPDLS